jgi:hypothetical protein
MPNDELTCQELVELVTSYLENALPVAERARFEKHVAGCDGCTAYMDQARLTIKITGHLTEDSLTPPARDELLNVFRAWKQEPQSD